MITHAQVLEAFEYRDGNLIWRKCKKSEHLGKPAGYLHSKHSRYWSIQINGRSYLAHRLIWFYHTGQWPTNDIDHIDQNKLNNCIENLRECTRAENMQNKSKRPEKNPYTGVSKPNKSGKYEAYIGINRQRIYLGVFNTAEAARDAYLAAKRIHHTFNPVPR